MDFCSFNHFLLSDADYCWFHNFLLLWLWFTFTGYFLPITFDDYLLIWLWFLGAYKIVCGWMLNRLDEWLIEEWMDALSGWVDALIDWWVVWCMYHCGGTCTHTACMEGGEKLCLILEPCKGPTLHFSQEYPQKGPIPIVEIFNMGVCGCILWIPLYYLQQSTLLTDKSQGM